MFNVTHIIQSGGLYILALFIFSEVGLFLGFFLPGDTLLIAAGVYAKQGHLNIAAAIVVAAVAAIAGDNLAFNLGKRYGRRLFEKDNIIFRRDHMLKSDAFYERYGPKTLLIAHFLPIIRSFSPLLAGISHMPYSKFLIYDGIGDIAWAASTTLLGYYVGSRIPNIDHYILGAIVLVIVLSVAPTLLHVIRLKSRRSK